MHGASNDGISKPSLNQVNLSNGWIGSMVRWIGGLTYQWAVKKIFNDYSYHIGILTQRIQKSIYDISNSLSKAINYRKTDLSRCLLRPYSIMLLREVSS